jgi:methylmalonyl-CoA mutase N-terminal domain/subunit
VRAGRSQSAGPKKLAALEGEASGSDNLMPPIVDAVGVDATVGEISDCLRGVFGDYRKCGEPAQRP